MEDLVTAIVALLELLPEPHKRVALALMAVLSSLYATGAFWAGVRWAVAKWLPAGREPGWFAALDIVMQAITASSSRVSTRSVPPKESDK